MSVWPRIRGENRRGQARLAVLLGLAASAAVSSGCRASSGTTSAIVISEFLASNSSGLEDSDGETSDWIELYNRGKTTVNLEGWRLTDDPEVSDRFVFPSVSLEPEQYLVVFASGKAPLPGERQLHAGFRLKASPDYLALLDASGRLAQQFAPYPEQRSDVSYGLGSDGVTGFLSGPTPGAANAPAIAKKAKSKAPQSGRNEDGELLP